MHRFPFPQAGISPFPEHLHHKQTQAAIQTHLLCNSKKNIDITEHWKLSHSFYILYDVKIHSTAVTNNFEIC